MTRNLCIRCLKSQETCYCDQVRSFRSRVHFVLLQHPLERKKTIGTARMAHLCIQNSRLIQGTEFDDDSRVRELIADPQNHCVVLFPGANSIQIDAADSRTLADAFPENKTLVVFVIDGTWACAKRMVRRSRNLSSLQQICFSPKKESEYRIRKQPDSHCLSTIEAVHRILEILDPSVDPGILLQVFRTMVEQQISYSGRYKIRRVAADYVPTSSCSS